MSGPKDLLGPFPIAARPVRASKDAMQLNCANESCLVPHRPLPCLVVGTPYDNIHVETVELVAAALGC
jgi:hypothetical protein